MNHNVCNDCRRMLPQVDSQKIFKQYLISWKLLGVGWDRSSSVTLCGLYDIVLTVMVTICYPLHLIIGLIQSQTQIEVFSNLVINVSCFACSVKQFAYRRKLRQMRQMVDEYASLDERVQHTEERAYLQDEVLRALNRLFMMFLCIYGSVGVTSILSSLMASERRLMYPAWFPFDWTASTFNYACAIVYQFIGLYVQIAQNFANDFYGPLSMGMFAGHVHALRIRVAKVGHDETISEETHERELVACVGDYERLMRIYTLVTETLSMGYFVQFVASALNICGVVIFLIFFADGVFVYIYYMMHLTGILIELFPGCYYGSLLELEFQALPYAIFSCNWLGKGRKFRRNVVIFAQLSLRIITMLAGGMMRIHLDSFFISCKMAYSFFTLISKMK